VEYLGLLLHVVGCAGAVRYFLLGFVLSVDYSILEWCSVLVRGLRRFEDGGGGVGFGGREHGRGADAKGLLLR